MKTSGLFKGFSKTQCEWCDYKGASFLIAPSDTPKMKREILNRFTLEQASMLEPSKGADSAKSLTGLSAGQALEKIYGAQAYALVHDWKDIEDDNGKAMTFDHGQVFEWMMDDDEFSTWIVDNANRISDKKNVKEAEITKN